MSESNNVYTQILKGLAVAGSALGSIILAQKCSDSISQREKQLKELAALVQKKAQAIQNDHSGEFDGENPLEYQIIQGIANKTSQKDMKSTLEDLNLEKQVSKAVAENYNKTIYKICITGGPCAGKTSGLVLLSEKLRDEGFNVFTVPEAATMIANGGGMIDMSAYNETQQINFQKALMKSQIQLEDSFLGISKLSNRKSVILCDRGLMDGSAYLPPNLWSKMLDQMGITEVQIRDKRYDCVIHLVTAADGAEKNYNKDNDVRHESPQEAIVVDRKLQLAWLGHPNYQIIDNHQVQNFEDKLDKLVTVVRQAVGLPGLINKVNKRFLIELASLAQTQTNQDLKIQKFYIEDVFIQHNLPIDGSDHKIYTKVRRRGQGSSFVYLWSQNEFKNGVQVSTQKKQLNFKEYLFLLSLRDPTRQSLIKERLCFMCDGIYYVIDNYLNVKEGFSLLKAKLQEDQVSKIPKFIQINRDVTNEQGYTSRVLAKRDWYIPEGDEEVLNIRKDSL